MKADDFLGPDSGVVDQQANRAVQGAADATQVAPPPASPGATLMPSTAPPAAPVAPPRAMPQSITDRMPSRDKAPDGTLEPLPQQQPLSGSVSFPPDRQAEFRLRNDTDFGLKRDTEKNLDYYSGVDDNGFRTGLSFVNKKEDRARYLDNRVGKGNWG